MGENSASEVFRFTVVRPPEAVAPDQRVELPSVDDVGGIATARKLAAEVEEAYRTRGEASIEGVASDRLQEMLTAVLLFGSDGRVPNAIASALRSDAPTDPAGLPKGPLVVDNLDRLGEEEEDTDDRESRRRAHFGPVGVGDLMIVEQHLTGYELGEIAHIENVMATETRKRLHVVETDRETIFETEEEITRFMEQDLQSVERFELQTAAEEEIQQRTQVEAGLQVSGSYGPTVEVQSSLDYSLENAKQKSSSRASSYAQEVTERSIKRTQERIRERRQERRRTQTKDRNLHSFENDLSEHIVGIYRYVDKLYTMKLVNRGKRFFYEFIVPDPGAYLRSLRQQTPTSRLPKPRKPNETVESINPGNYAQKLRRYGIVNVSPPPAGRVTKVVTFSDRDTGEGGAQRFLKEGEMQIPPGHRAASAHVTIVAWEQHKTDPLIHISVGDEQRRWSGPPQRRDSTMRRDAPEELVVFDDLGGQTGSIGYSCMIRHDSVVQVKIELQCKPTEQALLEWQHSVYDAIYDDYQKKLTEYNAAKAEEAATGYPEPFEAPPQRLREIERDELKRLCLQLMGQRARLVDPLSEGDVPLVVEAGEAPLEEGEGDELVRVDRLEPLAKEIRFGEQAFEWSNMSFVLYPYYWTDTNEWDDLVTLDHIDPQHGQFLRAGAARVLVPVRDNFRDVVHNFFALGRRALDFAEEVEVTDPLWLPLYKEIEEQKGAPSRREEVIRCWPERVSTTLVMLDPDSRLPSFPGPTDCPTPDGDD